ncbi:RNA polymerase sigma-70 factor [Carboxylicivirga sp. M1479]|uniref:RNA polymerase sigma-70 factor n=1 Tax=Carboxylicivirga sp. M1479 TaxID=2594476 RepID=UPI00163D7E7F|nr:RNA polymerase sigma-70 factor [Carboxylicivirga sp. M1479]
MKSGEINTTIVKFLDGNDIASYRVIYQHYFKGLCLFAYEYLRDTSAAEDLVQDVFVHIWEKDLQIREPEKLPAYMYSMVRTRCLNQIRGNKVRQQYVHHEKDKDYWEDDVQHAIIKAEVFKELSESLEQLPEKTREIFELSYLTQLREKEIADRLGITVDMVKAHKKKARGILRNELKHLMSLIIILNI